MAETKHHFAAHEEGDSDYNHASDKVKVSVLGTAVLLTLSFSAIELVGGIYGNSLALIGDAGHMVTDTPEESAALALKTGCDVNCGNTYIYMMKAYEKGLVTEEDI
ncbi:MAG: cation transporter, partial [Duodenibacillus sp.]|nr:cation transporter [Duodenibacillus sp.]